MDLELWEGDRVFLNKMLEGIETVNLTLRYHDNELIGTEERK